MNGDGPLEFMRFAAEQRTQQTYVRPNNTMFVQSIFHSIFTCQVTKEGFKKSNVV